MTPGWEVAFVVSPEPNHRPTCPIEPERYDRLYLFNQGLDDQLPEVAEWSEIRIKVGWPADEVYRLLPSAVDFEYSGYLTKSRVRFFEAGPSSAGMLMA